MKLSTYYRKWLKGSDLGEKPHQVEILKIGEVTVQPRPDQPVVRLCLFVKGMPDHFPTGILMGPEMVENLVEIFGQSVDSEDLIGKQLVIFPKKVMVAGEQREGIRFRPLQGGDNGAKPKPAAPAPPAPPQVQPATPDDLPF